MDSYLPALDAANGVIPTPKNISRLAETYGEEATTWAFSQWSLRKRAGTKFARADEMFFTKSGLEQASHEAVAMYHASRFPGGEVVADLTCGIGADTIALTERGPAVGFEIDGRTAWCARKNVGDQTKILEADCLSEAWDFRYAFLDPSRRLGTVRTLDPNSFSPNPVLLAERLRGLEFAGMKLSPMLHDDFLAGLASEIEFLSFGGECREAIAWFGGSGAGVTARKIESGDVLSVGAQFASYAETPSAYLFEADPAAIRAHCLGTLCEIHSAKLLGDSNGYLTSDKLAGSGWLKAYRVLESGSFDEKRIRRTLKSFGGGTPIIKSRGVQIDVVKLSKSLASPGSGNAIVVLYGIGKSVRYLIVESLQRGPEAT